MTDKLKSYAAAKRIIMPGVEHRQHKGANNRVENLHQPTRRRERQMKRFKSPRQMPRFLSIHDTTANLFHFRRAAGRLIPRSLSIRGRTAPAIIIGANELTAPNPIPFVSSLHYR